MSTIRLEPGDMREVLKRLKDEGARVHAAATDPPYHLASIVKRFGGEDAKAPKSSGATGVYKRAARGFMGQQWDGGDIAFKPETWRLVWELLPPGGYLTAFSGTRTYHRMACAIEDAGFIILDMVAWLYGSGFPKSHDFGAHFDKMLLGIDPMDDPKDWEMSRSHFATYWGAFGSALKPALEPVCLAMRPRDGSIADNVLEHGAGALNIDGCRIAAEERAAFEYFETGAKRGFDGGIKGGAQIGAHSLGRWPANVVHDGSEQVLRLFPRQAGAFAPVRGTEPSSSTKSVFGQIDRQASNAFHGDAGGADRFFYSAKADAADRLGSAHPTVKPVDLMRWLVRLITPPGGTVLDPFAGSGTTGMACMAEGFDAILVEREPQYIADIRRRIAHVRGEDTPLFAGPSK